MLGQCAGYKTDRGNLNIETFEIRWDILDFSGELGFGLDLAVGINNTKADGAKRDVECDIVSHRCPSRRMFHRILPGARL